MRYLSRGKFGVVRKMLNAGQRESRKETLRKMQANQCCWCGLPMQNEKPTKWDYETIEHLTPRSLGGRDTMDNLALAHKKCNEQRGTKAREPLLRRVARSRTSPGGSKS